MPRTEADHRLGELGLREQYDEIIIPKTTSRRRVHIPKRDEGTETLCRHMSHSRSLKRKPMNAYPDDWAGWCKECTEMAGHV